jgi:hypothetical protein
VGGGLHGVASAAGVHFRGDWKGCAAVMPKGEYLDLVSLRGDLLDDPVSKPMHDGSPDFAVYSRHRREGARKLSNEIGCVVIESSRARPQPG